MQLSVKALKDHYIICGASHTGLFIAEELAKTAYPFVIIENNHDLAHELLYRSFLTIDADATEDRALAMAAIKRAKGLFCCLKNDRDNAFVALTARILN
ncbi:MAG: NAD-binding protein, partial [Elusimicrobiaceae bacterium]|nr:NAD-binding protein [Elusimicrobiaceae bacterium]